MPTAAAPTLLIINVGSIATFLPNNSVLVEAPPGGRTECKPQTLCAGCCVLWSTQNAQSRTRPSCLVGCGPEVVWGVEGALRRPFC